MVEKTKPDTFGKTKELLHLPQQHLLGKADAGIPFMQCNHNLLTLPQLDQN